MTTVVIANNGDDEYADDDDDDDDDNDADAQVGVGWIGVERNCVNCDNDEQHAQRDRNKQARHRRRVVASSLSHLARFSFSSLYVFTFQSLITESRSI